MGKPSETRRVVLERARATGLTGRQIEQQVPLPQGFLSKAARGGNDSLRAEASWERLDEWLIARQAGGDQAANVAAPPVVSASPPAPSSPTAIDDAKRRRLVEASKAAKKLEDLDAIESMVFEGVVEGWLGGAKVPRLLDALKERRQLFRAIEEKNARTSTSGPMTIEVVYVEDWRTPSPLSSSRLTTASPSA